MIMKDDKDPSGSWIRIGMLGLVGRGPETVLVRLGTSHALSDGACYVLLTAVAIWGKDKRLKRRLDVCACA